MANKKEPLFNGDKEFTEWTAEELIKLLQTYPPKTKVRVTYEGQVEGFYVYQAANNGPILLDADGGWYRERFESGETEAK